MHYTLCIETATKTCSAALFEGEELIDFKESNDTYSHAENLAVFIDKVLKNNNIDYSELKAIAVTKGPGSYTGLRIGVSLAKGLAFSLNIPLVAIDSLKSLAWAARMVAEDKTQYYCPMIDAKRMEVYSAIYNNQLEEIKTISADIIDSNSYLEYLDKSRINFFGDGAKKCKEIIQHPNAQFIEIKTSARNMGTLAEEAFQKNKTEDIAYFEPFYLKQFVAHKSKKLT